MFAKTMTLYIFGKWTNNKILMDYSTISKIVTDKNT